MPTQTDDSAHLVIIQPTPFCNIACRYCYLSTQARADTTRMSDETLTRIFEALYAEDLVGRDTEIVWHAGEPLVLPIAFYEHATRLLKSVSGGGIVPRQLIQTNATLITDEWCKFIRDHDIIIGVSLDGPAHIHDRHRVNRRGKGTHAQTMRGIDLLQRHHIPINIISVVTEDALDYPEELFQFFVGHGLYRLAFNIEEITGSHHRSSLDQDQHLSRWKHFLQVLYDLQATCNKPVLIREFKNMSRALMLADANRNYTVTTPLRMLNFDVAGNFSTFCFELLSATHERFGNFIYGNIHHDTIRSLCQHPKFERVYAEILAGIAACKATCDYFAVCGGGIPSNKVTESGSFDVTETMQCRLHVQALADVLRGSPPTNCTTPKIMS